MSPHQLLQHAQRLQALAQSGLAYGTNPYDIERYEEIRTISAKLLQELTDEPFEKIMQVFASETGYQTPKIDVRAVVLRDHDEILLVREKLDSGRWTFPGGWGDIGLTPSEVAVKEVREETGLIVRATRLLGVLDKREHAHPPQPWYVYKIFIQCEQEGGELLRETTETLEAGWFQEQALPSLDLSTDRLTLPQLEKMFHLAQNPGLPAVYD